GQGETELAFRGARATTDASGAFAFAGLTDGELRLRVSAPGLVPQSRSLRLQPAEVRAGEDFVLERGFMLRGRVRDAAGTPLEGANVEARALDEQAFTSGDLFTDADGRFELSGLPGGPKQLLVFKAGYAGHWQQVEPGGPELDIVLQPAPMLVGFVTHAVHGGPITRFDVTITYEGSTWVNSGGEYAEGRFELPIDEDRACTVKVRAGGFREVVLEDVLPSQTMRVPLRVRLQPE
ncbi:MAG TPA: carboxypeptidase-like regulatory domain-containing protein, partial [Planctomycetota bacterium]|nr:carboxypeptidase-like regulatory domain-containing protein [Planctomycetota bacterium]